MTIKIVVAPNAFKGSLTARQAAQAMAEGVVKVVPGAEIVQVPVADGGDGLVDVALDTLGGEAHRLTVTGPLKAPVQATFCHVPAMRFAAVEMALASGLALLPREGRDVMGSNTRGTGELLKAALDLQVSRIAVGIGGSATNDGGTGMAAALGVRFLNEHGREIEPTGGSLQQIRRIDVSDLDPRIRRTQIEAVCDVDNPLCGERGAAFVFGPQKGATPEQVRELDAGLASLADVIEADLGIDVRNIPGAGAAGGLGAGLKAFCGAELRRGVDLVLGLVGLDEKLDGAQLVLTGEGQIDFQTAFGKAPAGVGAAAKAKGAACLVIAGSVSPQLGSLHDIGIDAVFTLCPGPITLAEALAGGAALLTTATEQAVRCFLAGARTQVATRLATGNTVPELTTQ